MKQMQLNRVEPLDYTMREAFNTLCTNLSFSGSNVKKIMFTSCRANEGKSYLVMNVGAIMSKMGNRVVVVDCDLRKSVFVSRYDAHTDGEIVGMTHYLAGHSELSDVLYQTNHSGVCVIPAGRDVVNPMPLLNSPRFGQLLDELTKYFDVVLVDAPPVGLVIDPALIARESDGVVFVVEYNVTRRRELQEAKHQMMQAGTAILGCVLNKVTFDTISSKKYYNRTYYSHYSSEYYRHTPQGDGKSNKSKGKDR